MRSDHQRDCSFDRLCRDRRIGTPVHVCREVAEVALGGGHPRIASAGSGSSRVGCANLKRSCHPPGWPTCSTRLPATIRSRCRPPSAEPSRQSSPHWSRQLRSRGALRARGRRDRRRPRHVPHPNPTGPEGCAIGAGRDRSAVAARLGGGNRFGFRKTSRSRGMIGACACSSPKTRVQSATCLLAD